MPTQDDLRAMLEAGLNPGTPEFANYARGTQAGESLPSGMLGDALAPFLIAGLGASRAGKEVVTALRPLQGIAEAQMTGVPYFPTEDVSTSPNNVVSFIKGLTEGAVYRRPRKEKKK